ncbi:5-formyltetrahydrofolate cyclo-ligase [Ureibacillus acetophenoni]|uniref:5-formyltetrahydrofolate cyclo-ligase n=1 Tax=Ureibacillus acetophenoni TaxID=614649 RepID=A0A285U475_9BACL|nr:5-formyltetrahydrofolate cyclo-ligase [Ureibacillus acetophenoni]SOC36228.1 5-formyltetrahydrofolate cyclo-ligase [Ureibacillus acetophenoni]
MDKKEMRSKVKAALADLTDEQYVQYSNSIIEKLLMEDTVQNANTVAITLSNRPEVDTYQLIEKLWESKKRVVVPKCNPKDRSMQFYELQHFNQLETVYMNLKEPDPEKTIPIKSENIDIIVVPGVVYDMTGYRIGFGGGYYDRYLVNYNGTLITLAFDLQVIKNVPSESHDIPVDLIITEKRRIDTLRNRKGSSN